MTNRQISMLNETVLEFLLTIVWFYFFFANLHLYPFSCVKFEPQSITFGYTYPCFQYVLIQNNLKNRFL